MAAGLMNKPYSMDLMVDLVETLDTKPGSYKTEIYTEAA